MKNIQDFKKIQTLKIIQGFQTVIIGEVFRNNIFCEVIHFPNAKNSYIATKLYERPCSLDCFFVPLITCFLDSLVFIFLTFKEATSDTYFTYHNAFMKTLYTTLYLSLH